MLKKESGRPQAEKIPEELLDTIKKYPFFPYSPFQEGASPYTEAQKFQSVVREMDHLILAYIKKNPDDLEIKNIIQDKLQHLADDFFNGKYPGELLDSKTLQRCFKDERASSHTINILKAFKKAADFQEGQYEYINRIAGLYYQFVTHSTTNESGKFQYSLYKFARPDEHTRSFTIYIDEDHKWQKRHFKTEIIGNKGLFLSNDDDESILTFYIYMGDTTVSPSFLQGVFIYRNRRGNVVANLAVFQKIKLRAGETEENIIKNFQPLREIGDLSVSEYDKDQQTVLGNPSLTVRQNIQRFLIQKNIPISTLSIENVKSFDFSQKVAAEPGAFNRPALFYENMEKFKGNYSIYFNENFSSIRPQQGYPSQTEHFSSVGEGRLRIFQDEITGAWKTEMKIQRGQKILIYKGYVLNHQLNTASYFILSLYLHPENHRYINLLLKEINEDQIFGSFTITYLQPGKLSSGNVIVLRDSDNEKDKDPTSYAVHSERVEGRESVLNFLSRRSKSIVAVPDVMELAGYKDTIYKGIYAVYHIDLRGVMKVSLLTIHKNGYLFLLGSNGNYADGELEETFHCLNMTFIGEQTGYKWFLTVRVNGLPPIPGEDFYSAAAAGISMEENYMPFTSHYILLFIDKEVPDRENLSKILAEQEQRIPSRVKEFFKKYQNMTIVSPAFSNTN